MSKICEIDIALERHNMRKAAKRSQSVMYRGGRPNNGHESRRKSTLRISNSVNASGDMLVNENDSMVLMSRRKKSVKNM